MASTRPLISKFSCPFNKTSLTIPKALIMIGIKATFMFHTFFNSLGKLRYVPFFSLSTILLYGKVHNFASSLFLLLIILRSGRLDEIRRYVYMSKSHRSLCVSFYRTDAGLCIYYLFIWSNLNFWHNSLWIILPTQLCLVLYSFCANVLHSLIM